MSTLMNKSLITAITLAGFAFTAAPAVAKTSPEIAMPATEHQAEALKKLPDQAENAFTSSKKKATFVAEPLNNDRQLPATIHQEETLAGYDDAREDVTKRFN